MLNQITKNGVFAPVNSPGDVKAEAFVESCCQAISLGMEHLRPFFEAGENYSTESHTLWLADPRFNAFAEVAIHLALRGAATWQYDDFLKKLGDHPTATAAEIATASRQRRDFLEWSNSFNQVCKHLCAAGVRLTLERGDPVEEGIMLATIRESQRGFPEPMALPCAATIADHRRFVRRFVDVRHQDTAGAAIYNRYGLSGTQAESHIYEWYINKFLNPGAEYSARDALHFYLAHHHADKKALEGALLTPALLCEFNSLFLHGSTSFADESIRSVPVKFGREGARLRELFRPDGTFKSSVPERISYEGFVETKQDLTLPDYLSIDSVRALMHPSPFDLAVVQGASSYDVQVYPPIGADKLRLHLNRVTDHLHREQQELLDGVHMGHFDIETEKGLDDYVREVTRQAAVYARALEVVHFPTEANGRTGLLAERFLAQSFGISLPDRLDGEIAVRTSGPLEGDREMILKSENGTWMREEDRIALLYQGALSVGLDRSAIRSAVEQLNGSFARKRASLEREVSGDAAHLKWVQRSVAMVARAWSWLSTLGTGWVGAR